MKKIFLTLMILFSGLVSQAAYNPFTPDVVKVTNTVLANANLAAATQFNNINTTAVVNTDTDVFTSVDTDGVNCVAGTYIVDVVLYQEPASSNRTNVSVEVTLDGTGTGIVGASGYARRSDGHNESTSIISDAVTLTTAGKIGFQFQGIGRAGITVAIPVGQSMMRITRVKD